MIGSVRVLGFFLNAWRGALQKMRLYMISIVAGEVLSFKRKRIVQR